MFGGTKPTFGAAPTNQGFGNFTNTSQASPFAAQSTFGKQAAPGFGQAATFGQQNASLFGTTTQAGGGLFGGTTAPAFGTTTTTQPGFGGFSQPQQQQQQQQQQLQQQQQQQPQQLGNTSMFGTAQANTSLFGPASSSAFGTANKPTTFGFGSAQPSSLFSQASTSTAAVAPGFSGFGQNTLSGTNNVFGSTVAPSFGQQQQTQQTGGIGIGMGNTGTSIAKFQPSVGTDTLLKNGQTNSINTKHHCITAMKEYEGKSLEELRMEDYSSNRKGPQPGGLSGGGMFGQNTAVTGSAGGGGVGVGMFGAQTAQQTTGIFGQQPQTNTNTMGSFGQQPNTLGGFGQQNLGGGFGQTTQAQTGMFGKPFSAPTTSTAGGFGTTGAFGATNTNPFGAKPFGQTGATTGGGLFGQTVTSTNNSVFGQSTGFGSFGQNTQQQQQQQAAPLFGGTLPGAGGIGTSQPNTGFGLATAAPTTGYFGANTNTGGGMFGQKPNTGFGATTNFGAASTAPAFTGFGQTNPAGSLFGNNTFNKPTTGFTGFGQPTVPTIGGGVGFGTGLGNPGLFGNNANKPGGLFGNTMPSGGGGLFGSTPFGATNPVAGGLGLNTLNYGQNMMNSQPQTNSTIHQQILALATSPYGDNPLFKDLKATVPNEEALKPTNPAAQKAILEYTSNQYKLSPKIGKELRIKPLGVITSKKTLFEGLEEYDKSVAESFNLKPNAKRLILKAKSSSPKTLATTSTSLSNIANQNSSATDTNNSTIIITTTTTTTTATTATTYTTPTNINSVSKTSALLSSGTGMLNKQLSSSLNQSPDNNNSVSFTNQIPLEHTSSVDERRSSWLHSNALQLEQQRLSDIILENTMEELVTGKKTNASFSNSFGNNHNERSGTTKTHFNAQLSGESLIESPSFLDNTNIDLSLINTEPHPTGIILQRPGYYTIPSVDDLNAYLSEEGSCIVPNFTIGRMGYGNVYFNEPIDVSGLNLDAIVHFHHKEVIVYPDDDNKPDVGIDLNRKAQITLDQVWPIDKTLHEPIKDFERLEAMDYEGKLRRVCDKYDTRFIEYRPETGSWVFKVDHFSKYGLSDSDEETIPMDPKKLKLTIQNQPQQHTTTLGQVNGLSQEAENMNQKSMIDDTNNKQQANNITIDLATGLHSGRGALSSIAYDQEYLDKDENSMDFHTSNFNVRDATTSASAITLTSRLNTISPTTVLAKDMGTDSHKLQLMKASFFMDEDFDGKSVISEQFDGRDSPDQIVPNKPFLSNLNTFQLSQPSTSNSNVDTPLESPVILPPAPVAEIKQRTHLKTIKPLMQRPDEPKALPLIIKPKIAMIKIPGTIIPLSKSIGYKSMKGDCVSDAAFFHGRRFKIGWGPQNTIMLLNTKDNCQQLEMENNIDDLSKLFNGRSITDHSPACIQTLKIKSTIQINSFYETIEQHLLTQLKYSINKEVENTDCPQILPGGGTNIILDHYKIAQSLMDETDVMNGNNDLEIYGTSVWSLLNALWCEKEELEDQLPTSHLTIMRRCELLSEWLESVVKLNPKSMSIDRNEVQRNDTDYLEHLLNLLYCHKVIDACELSFKNNDLNLTLLLAQLSGGPTVRQLIQHQLSSWQDVEADKYISIERLKALMLVAGVPLLSSAHGTINIYDGLDWLKAFAINLWYIASPTASVTDALLLYENAFKSAEFSAMEPQPPYTNAYQPQQQQQRSQNLESSEEKKSIHDLRYHILKLYSKRSYPLESLLNPITHTIDSMDFRLSWLLLQVLETLGYNHCSAQSKSQIHISFANQLENYGLWHWSIFVLLHLENQMQRELKIQDLLYRYITLSNNAEYLQQEEFIINELGIPEKWIYWAKAVRAGSKKKYHIQADYLLKAKQWALAHDVIMTHLAADAVINENINYIKNLLERIDDPRKVPNWCNQGMIILDYIDINETFDNLKTIHASDIELRWESLKPQLSDLCSRINLFPCPTAKHRLCQSEIAQRLACLVSGVRLLCPNLNPCVLIKIALEKLPLPQEYAQQKLRTLLEDSNLIDMLQHQQ